MAKLTLNTIGSRYGSIDALNDNFNAIETAIENTFSLDGTSPNALEADLDMNGNQILNASTINASTLIIGGQTLEPGDAVASATVQVFEFTATAGQTSFSVSPLTPAASSVLMEVNGLSLPTSSLVTSGSTLSFPALSLNDEVVVKVFTKEIGAYPAITNNEVAANAAIVSSKLAFTQAGTGAVTRTVQSKMREQVSIFDYMTSAEIADVQAGTLTLDCAAAFNTALAASKNIYFPPGKYRFNSTITINGARGLTLFGSAAALLAGGTGYTGTTELYFSNAPSNSNGIVITDFTGVTISDMSIVMRRGGAGVGYALFMYNGHDYALQNLKIDTAVNAGGGGVKLGNGSGATATFIGNLRNVKCIVDGAQAAGIYWDFGTSLTAQNCYVIGGRFYIKGMGYCSLNSCAVDSSSLYAYIIEGSSNIGLYACGAEQAQKGAFYLSTTSSNIHIDAPYGAANNQSADATIGDLVHIDNSAGAVNSITITNPTSVSPNAATVQNIYSNSGGGFVEVLNTDSTLLSLGIGGNSVWLRDKLTVTGYWDQMISWTPVLSGWSNVGSPTIIGKYKRVGKIVTFYVKVTPATSISATKVTSSITGFPFTNAQIGSVMMTDGNANSYGVCAVGGTGIIYPQTSGVLTVDISFVGTVILP